MLFVYIGVAWLLGIYVGGYFAIDLQIWNIATLIAFVGGVLTRRQEPTMRLWLACTLAFCIGGFRVTIAAPVHVEQHIRQFNDNPRSVTITGLVVAEPDIRDKSILLRVAVETVTVRTLDNPDGVTDSAEGIILVHALRFPIVEYGSRIQVSGKLTTPFEDEAFSYKDYLAKENIYSTMFLPHLTVLETGQGNPFMAALLQFKHSAETTIATIIPAPQSALLQAVLLGAKSDLPETVVTDFRTVGLSHMIAISGFHVAIIMLAVLKMVEPLLPPKAAVLVTSLLLIGYALLVGGRPSVVRAVIMGIAYLLGEKIFGRNSFTLGILFATAILMTAYNPQIVYDVGFQLSFAATLGLILYAAKLDRWTKTRLLNLGLARRWVKGPVGTLISIVVVSLAAQILTLPLIALYFEQISLMTLVANALVIPIQPFIIMGGGVATLLGLAFEPLGRLVGWVVNIPLLYTLKTVQLLAHVPYASLPVSLPNPPVTLVVAYSAIAAATWVAAQEADRRMLLRARLATNFVQRMLAGVGATTALLVFIWGGSQPDGLLHVKFFDVGQGDAIFIQTPTGRQILIDGGYFPSVINAELGKTLPFYDRTLDMVMVTHPDADHVTGLPGVLDRYTVAQLLTTTTDRGISDYYDALLEKVAEHHVPLRTVQAGETIIVEDGVRLEVVHPTTELDETSRNDNSLSVRVVYGDFALLLTGDAESGAEREMVERGLPLQAAVLKAGHHGSRTSSTPFFLAVVRPKIIIVSAGEENKFGHPHPEPLAAFANRGATVLSTIELGTIEVVTDGTQMWWEAGGK